MPIWNIQITTYDIGIDGSQLQLIRYRTRIHANSTDLGLPIPLFAHC
jgi:hypothetical protein